MTLSAAAAAVLCTSLFTWTLGHCRLVSVPGMTAETVDDRIIQLRISRKGRVSVRPFETGNRVGRERSVGELLTSIDDGERRH